MSEVQQRTDDVTSAGATNLGIMSATDQYGAIPYAGYFHIPLLNIQTGQHQSRTAPRLFCFAELQGGIRERCICADTKLLLQDIPKHQIADGA